ncbi:hypothetical protein VPH35_044175 [Triticum aestivum]
MRKTEPPMSTGQFRRALSWEEAHQSSSTGGDEGRGRGQRRAVGRGICLWSPPSETTGPGNSDFSLIASFPQVVWLIFSMWTDVMICTREQQVEEIQSQFCSAIVSSIDNKSAQQPDVVSKRRKREHWRKRQQDIFSKLSQMFEQLEDSYNHFSLALLHLDVNRLWKSYNCAYNSHDPITVCSDDKIEQLLLE